VDVAHIDSSVRLKLDRLKHHHRLAFVRFSGPASLDGSHQPGRVGRVHLVVDAVVRVPIHTYSACVSRTSSGMMSSARSCVASKSTGHALPAFTANSHVRAHTHHEFPGFKPGKLNRGAGVMRSLPISFAKRRKSSFNTQQTVCEPWSFSSVLQQPSLYQPVNGSREQGSRFVPRTFTLGCMEAAG